MDPSLLWHYTGWNGLKGIFQNNEIWASHISYLNDAREFKHGYELIAAAVQTLPFANMLSLGPAPSAPDVNYFVTSFSAAFDDLGQWRAYAGAGPGFAVGFDRNELKRVATQVDAEFRECKYPKSTDTLQGISENLDNKLAEFGSLYAETQMPGPGQYAAGKKLSLMTGPFVAKDLPNAAAGIKDYSFSSEAESRFILAEPDGVKCPLGFHTKGSLVVPHRVISWLEKDDLARMIKPYPLRAVLIGPTAGMDLAMKSVRMLVDSCKKPSTIAIAKSQVPYRNW